MAIQYTVENWPEIKKNWANVSKIVERNFSAAIYESLFEMHRGLIDDGVTPVLTGDLKRSIGVSEVKITQEVMIGRVGSPLNYAIPVEIGVRQHERTSKSGKTFTYPKDGDRPGRFMFLKTLTKYEPNIIKRLDKATKQIFSELNGE